ncbi:biotin--[acetyl-CoA-carboxylase] ligase [Candidatus Phycorickettsia trachydisci]|nr:biotin--[acetyl-CoA-carboxylase] ligase [Candidatus Phycorickettsia trachydisci]
MQNQISNTSEYKLKSGIKIYHHHYNIIPSTQILAREQIHKIKQDSWYLWTANGQTQSIGQRDRKWIAPTNVNVNATYGFLISESQFSLAKFIPYVAGLSIIQVLRKYNLQGKIKWVNDVLISKKKVCGILVENRGKDPSTELYRILVGIGININSEISDFVDLGNKATSMKIETNTSYNIQDIILELSNSFEANMKFLLDSVNLIDEINNNLEKFDGQAITFDTEFDGQHEGIIQGVDNNGALILLIGDKVHNFVNGRILAPIP